MEEDKIRRARASVADDCVETGKKKKKSKEDSSTDSDSESDHDSGKGTVEAALKVRASMAHSQFGRVISAGMMSAKTLQGATLMVYNGETHSLLSCVMPHVHSSV